MSGVQIMKSKKKKKLLKRGMKVIVDPYCDKGTVKDNYPNLLFGKEYTITGIEMCDVRSEENCVACPGLIRLSRHSTHDCYFIGHSCILTPLNIEDCCLDTILGVSPYDKEES